MIKRPKASQRSQAGEDHPRPRQRVQSATDGGSGWRQSSGSRKMGKPLCEMRALRSCRSPPLRSQAGDCRANPCRNHHPGDIAAAGPDPMVLPRHGQSQRGVQLHGRTAVAANDIKPHITRTFKISNDKNFEAKFWDVIGLYLDPPERALVLCCDEKSQCQALERTQPGLPLGPHRVRTGTHDYVRHGTITLFAALSYLDGKIPPDCRAPHPRGMAGLHQAPRKTNARRPDPPPHH